MRKALLSIMASLFCWACSNSGSDREISSPWDEETTAQDSTASDTAANAIDDTLDKFIDSLSILMAYERLSPTKNDRTYYPDAGIPRMLIATLSPERPDDDTTDVPAYAVITEGGAAITDTMPLMIRIRGNTSLAMPKRSFKATFTDKVTLLDMPENRDWALLANYGDKTLVKNYTAFKLSEWLGMAYSPRSRFVELFLNGNYRGVYQLCETIKVGKNRVNIPDNQDSYLVEVDRKYRDDESVVINEREMAFRIHAPKDPTEETMDRLRLHLDSLEGYLEYIHQDYSLALDSVPDNWFDVGAFIKHYWVQEFTKNPDAIPLTSVFFTWVAGSVIRMGPVWDFDAAFGATAELQGTDGWYIRDYSWYRRMLKMPNVKEASELFWKRNRAIFEALPDSIDAFAQAIAKAAENNYHGWPDVLGNVNEFTHTKAYGSYAEAVEDLKSWVRERTRWIDKNL